MCEIADRFDGDFFKLSSSKRVDGENDRKCSSEWRGNDKDDLLEENSEKSHNRSDDNNEHNLSPLCWKEKREEEEMKERIKNGMNF